ncbi:TlpA family protein disulfide reductase [Labilibaculum sp.]|uniref:TlpA family protein disulfide reductase n=1 Tax=Labilibaculum sp. TaxID=2060723 RepID=UPI0035670463
MKKTTLLLLFYSFTFLLTAQNKSKEDSQIKKQVLIGELTLEVFDTELCKNWYAPEYKEYHTNAKVLKKLKDVNLKQINITLVLGSWCHDSHREVPHFIKILKEIKFPLDQLQIYALDTHKSAPDFDAKADNIMYVPTAIISREGREIGHIIEQPKKSLEKDLMKIILKN